MLQRSRDRSSIYCFTPQMAQWPELSCSEAKRFYHVGTGSQKLEPPCVTFQPLSRERQLEVEQPGHEMPGCWNCR